MSPKGSPVKIVHDNFLISPVGVTELCDGITLLNKEERMCV